MPNGVTLFGFIAVSSALVSFPLMAAALLPRKTALAVCAAVALVGLATFFQVPLIQRILPGGSSPDDLAIFLLMNAFQSAWILGIVLLLRAGGYRLESRLNRPDS